MTRRFAAWGAALVLVVVGAGLAIAQSSTQNNASTPDSQPTPAQLADGKVLYAANCATCHGADGKGGQSRGIRGIARLSFDRFKNLILYGREEMPGYAKTGLSTSNGLGSLGSNGYLGNSKAPTDAQIQDLLAYLKTMPTANQGGFFGFRGGGDD